MTYIGAPMIYYGDEAGMWGADDPDERKPMLWEDLHYAVEKSHPLPGKRRPADSNVFNKNLFSYYKQMIALRHETPALLFGDFKIVEEASGQDVIGFSRKYQKQQAVMLFNRDNEDTILELSETSLNYQKYIDPLLSQTYEMDAGKISVNIPSNWYIILISK